jgi:hypothetical protein
MRVRIPLILGALVISLTCVMCASKAPSKAPSAPVQAKSAWQFTDSVGVNTHASYFDRSYNPQWETMATRLAEANIKHVRDGAMWDSGAGWMDAVYQKVHSLASRGIKFLMIFEPKAGISDDAYIREVLARCGSACEGAEGPNEKDGWSVQQMRSFQGTLYNTVKSVRPNIMVGAPSYIHCETYSRHGSYEDKADFGNFHPYQGGRHPETLGHETDGYPSLAWYLGCVRKQSPTEPVLATEVGYHNDTTQTNHAGVPEDIAGDYAPRLFLHNFMSGVERSYWYEALDQSPSSTQEHNFGLLNHDGTPKPAYTALKNTLAVLSDPNGANFTPGSLDYTIFGDTTKVKHLLLQKSDGRFYLAVWQDVSIYDVNTRTRLYPPNKSVNLTFTTRMTQIRVYKPNTQATPIKSFSNTAQISQTIRPQVKVYEITR